jgi:hypothetical protein
MKKRTFLNATMFLFCSVTLLTECKKEEQVSIVTEASPSKSVKSSARSYLSSNYLTFNSIVQYDSVIDVLSRLTESERRTWEISFDDGFKSMETIFVDDRRSDSIYDSELDTTKSLAADKYHCPSMMNELGKMYFAQDQPEGGYIVKLNLFFPYMSRVLNKFGVVRVGDYIFQFTKDYDKWILASQPDLISNMLTATSTDGSGQINVRPATGQPIIHQQGQYAKSEGCNDATPSWWTPVGNFWHVANQATFGPSGKYKITAETFYNYRIVSDNCRGMYSAYLSVDVYCLKRTWLGRWVAENADMTSNMSWTGNHPVNIKPGKVTYWANNRTDHQSNFLFFQDVSFSTYNSMFNPNNYLLYSTRSGGPSGGSVTNSH